MVVAPAQTQLSLQTIEKIQHMYAQLRVLFYNNDFETTDLKAKIVKKLIARDPNAMCKAKYTLAVNNMIDELEHNLDRNNFDFNKWLDKYISILPQDPLEALSYDLILYKMFISKH